MKTISTKKELRKDFDLSFHNSYASYRDPSLLYMSSYVTYSASTWLLTDVPGLFGLLPGLAYPTGIKEQELLFVKT
jgi:hypothetical protein